MSDEPRYRIVTKDQLAVGWMEMHHGITYHREFRVIRDRGDGTYVVAEPKPQIPARLYPGEWPR